MSSQIRISAGRIPAPRRMARPVGQATALVLAMALAGCGSGSNPLFGDGSDSGSGGSGGDATALPGTANPTAGGAITRSEDGGEAQLVGYDKASDTVTINNIPFDGDGVYDRDDQVPSLGTTRVYENNNTTERRAYKTLYSEGPSGKTRFAIVATGDYTDFGFGGFVYQRDIGVDIPTSGQATYSGDYSALRVYSGGDVANNLHYVSGDINLQADFSDFDSGDAVEGQVTGRQELATDGTFVKDLPALVIRTTSITTAGEMSGTVNEVPADPTATYPEVGDFYAVLSGDGANEIVGILLTGDADYKERGGFALVKSATP